MKKTIRKYIQDQERADIIQDKLSVKEYEDPFWLPVLRIRMLSMLHSSREPALN